MQTYGVWGICLLELIPNDVKILLILCFLISIRAGVGKLGMFLIRGGGP